MTFPTDQDPGGLGMGYKTVRAPDGDFMSPAALEPVIRELIEDVVEMNWTLDNVLGTDPDRRIVIEMHPRKFRELIIAVRVHYPAHMFYLSKPGEFEIYNVVFRAVPPAKDTPR